MFGSVSEKRTERRQSVDTDAGSGAPPPEEDGLGIGPAARRLGLHPRTLMAYERIGLVRPRRHRTRRRFSDNDLAWLSCVQELNRAGGVSLRGLSVLRRFVPCWAIRQQLQQPATGDEPHAAERLDRIDRAYAGTALASCRLCGVYRASSPETREALAARNARKR